ncbi:MAG: hypothetical protein JW910_21020, partial [Anaerolineae bacterium]|nr:hypothetical protein [Anaerolineae bacterium]
VAGEILRTFVQLALGLFNGPGADGRWHVFPLALVFALAGLILLWRSSSAFAKRLALACLGWIVLGMAATTTLQTATWHHHRYQMPLYPALIVPLALALSALAARIVQQRPARIQWMMRLAVIGVVVLWSALSLADFGAAYALDTGTVVAQQMIMADWLRDNTPEDALIAVHDVGAMRYLGQRTTFDVVGLTSEGMARAQRSGPGAIYEALEQVQPDFYAVYPDAAPPFYGLDWAADLLGEELFRVTAAPWSSYTSASPTQVVTRPDWSGTALADLPQQPDVLEALAGWRLTDRLDVADLNSEDAHDHTWWDDQVVEGFATVPRRLSYRADAAITLTDGGRWITGGEAFTLATPERGAWLVLVARVHQITAQTLRVTVDGVEAGLWRLPAIPGEWLESAFRVPPDLVRGAQTRVELEVVGGDTSGDRFRPFYFWAYQGQPPTHPPAPATISGAAFGEVVRLRGFDLPGRRFSPGESLTLLLYWEALTPDRAGQADRRVFVHVVAAQNDTAEGIVAQFDGPPRQGTYPFWVWREDETVTDAVQLTLPADTPAGEYVVLLGIYDPANGERLPIVGGQDYGASRLVLGRITVR